MEAEDLDIQVLLVLGRLLATVEFASFVDKLAARGASHGEGGHETDSLDFGAGLLGSPTAAFDLAVVEVWGVVLLQDFALGHGGGG